MGCEKKLAWTFGALAGTAALVAGCVGAHAGANEEKPYEKIYECHPEKVPMTALVVKWYRTGEYGLGILNADDRIVYAENNASLEPLQQKAELFCRTRRLTMTN